MIFLTNRSRVPLLLSFVTFLLFSTAPLHPATVTITAVNGGIQADLDTIASGINSNPDFLKLKSLDKLARGTLNANSAAAKSGTTFGYFDYENVIFSTGFLAGYQTSVSDSEIERNGDAYIHKGDSICFTNLGFNLSKYSSGTFLNIKGTAINSNHHGESSKYLLLGFGINKRIIDGAKYSMKLNEEYALKIIKWRGLFLGSGLNYHYADVGIITDYNAVYTAGSYEYDLDPEIEIHIYTYTIPIELTTSFQILTLFNLSGGAGADLNYGRANVKIRADDVEDSAGTSVGKVTINEKFASGIEADTFRPHVMAAGGLNFGNFKIDIPFYYYFGNDWATGLTIALLF